MLESPAFSRRWIVFFVPLGVLFCFVFPGATPISANNLPEDAPVLISETGSTRALTASPTKRGLDMTARVFKPSAETRITVFVTNLDLLKREGASAFRADAEDSLHRRFPLSVVSLEQTAERRWVYALTVQLHGGMGDVGDVLLRVAWRGMSSNRVRVAVGHEGDGLPDDAGAVPTPMPEQPIDRITPDAVGLAWSGDRVRFMNQAAFGANAALEARLRRMSYSTWINEQMEQKYDSNGVPRNSTFPYPTVYPLATAQVNGCESLPPALRPTCPREFYTMYPLQNWFYREALYGEDQQLRRRVSWALSQIWVVSGRDVVQSGQMLPYIKLLDQHAFGNYRQLMYEMTLNPAMGQYLDMANSTRQNPNENYAREILQLFAIGVDMLNIDGTPMLDNQGNRRPSYDQNTVNNFTKVFTGWTYCNNGANPACPSFQTGVPNYRDPMLVIPANHDTTQKTLLNGVVLPAGQTPEQDLDMAIENIFQHPNVGPFVGKLLIQQLVTSNPSPAYVERVARAFNGEAPYGNGLRGNMKSVIRAILLDPEARGNFKTDPDYGKLREPVLYATSVLRPFNVTSQQTVATGAQCNGQSDGILNPATLPLDQDVYNPPTVFNYYPLDYTIPNTNLAGPEFGIFSTGTALKRPNFVNQFFVPGNLTSTTSGITVPAINNPPTALNYIPCGTRVDASRLLPLASADPTGAQLVDTLNKEMMNGAMSQTVRAQILQAVQAVPQASADKRVRTAIYLVATSPQFQVQR